jgi:aryl-alcohol dehydrogenase-like predicted oxidoreductase
MDTATLGRTGLEVSKLSLGGLFAASRNGDIDNGIAVVRTAYELGINYVDTAPSYGDSQRVLGEIFQTTGPPSILSTKVGGPPATFEPQNPTALRAAIEESFSLLGVDCVDLFMVHEPDRPRHYDWWTDMAAVEGPVLEVLQAFQAEGRIKYLGLGGTGVTELAHLVNSGKFDVVLTAFNYSILFREAEDTIIPAAQAHNVGIIAGSPLQQGALATKYDAVFDDSVYWLHPTRRQQLKDLYAYSDEIGMSRERCGGRGWAAAAGGA